MLPILALLVACKREPSTSDPEPSPILDVPSTGAVTLPGLGAEAHVLRDSYGVPWIYAKDREDLGRVLGYVLASDRFFYMDLARRLSQGETAALLGADALSTDLEARMTGMTFIVDRVHAFLQDDPELGPYFQAVADGINAHIEAVRAGEAPAPTEYDIAHGLLGYEEAVDVMQPFDLRDMAAGVVTVLYESGFETTDLGRAGDAARLATAFAGAPMEAARTAGLLEDVWNDPTPPVALAAAPEWLDDEARSVRGPGPRRHRGAPVEPGALARLRAHADRIERRFGHDWNHGFGSNAWAVSAEASADGRAMLASDGHLQLSVPPLFYQLGMDTTELGGGDIHQVGMVTPAMPLLSTGTNGRTAFGQTQLMGDITDWYTEQIVLADDGTPTAAVFQGQDVPLRSFQETVDVAAVPLLGSQAASITVTRYTTDDGRWITSIEGTPVGGPDEAPPGKVAINLLGDWVVPGDTNDDGVVDGISFDYAGLDLSHMPATIDRYTRAETVDGFAEATRDLVAYSLNLVAADADGHVFFTGFQAVPCRRYLDRNDDGGWAEGADPSLLIDGTRYGGFTIPITADGRVDASQTDPARCVVPWDEYPHAKDPQQGFLVSANQDPGGWSLDGDLTNDPHYIGGPWIEGFRADQITRRLAERRDAGGVTLQDMIDIQGDHTSVIGRLLVPELLRAADEAATAASDEDSDTLARAKALYAAHAARIDDAVARIEAWEARGLQAASGVATFYDGEPTADQAADSVATMIFNAWMGRWMGHVVHDEGMPGLGWPTGDTGRFRLVRMALDGRGPGNPNDLAAWIPELQEPVWFDDRYTADLEGSTEIAVLSLVEALDWLATAPLEPGVGGFGSTDPDDWRWGLRHWTRFTSLLGDFFDADDPLLGSIIAPLNITPDLLPLAAGISGDDPRRDLPGFPRNGDHLNVDAGNSGTNGQTFDYGSGPVFRFVAALGDNGFEAYNALPGGQSGIADSDHFADQAELWLGNDVRQVPLEPAKVAAQAVERVVFSAE